MIRSMTAFAREEHQEIWGKVCWELRSVNHRHLDLSIRLPEEFRSLEPLFTERLQQKIKRGKVNCALYFQSTQQTNNALNINVELVNQIYQATRKINEITGQSSHVDALDILKFPGVLNLPTLDIEQISDTLLKHLDGAVKQLIAHREREGTQLALLIQQRCEAIAQAVQQIRAELPQILSGQRERLLNRLSELKELDNDRVEQEMVILAQKMDVAEELDRLETHLLEVKEIFTQDEPIGRRLDFLVQELHREANTLGSKANHISTTHCAIELKVLIEQIREQTQNIE
ncbi:YicC/YloC family endoribonuclease [Beggiatoa leptomitoformis]|uniref:YicC family protein n=1 Tax=Beggiatoa leptomitoformis TaxID=288004 RepID=A0A2N9YE31_9GAMM|nr:YicC/YloC family endoribonuclease [Beggiatoa leptomitoformis]ALG68916.1 YicC family protein [Beggiatoa leptomitoformis]AUI68706.1 YicC family protein [Beggiatoa leptomitoformis]